MGLAQIYKTKDGGTAMKTELTINIGDVEKIEYDSLNCQNIILKWSEEDEEMLLAAIDAVNVTANDLTQVGNAHDIITWLKSLKERMQ